MWSERPLVDSGCQHTALFSLCLLIVPLCHWKMSARSNKICGALECLSPFPPLSILESGNRSICDESKPDIVVKVGQTPFHQAPAQKKFFFLQTSENICLKEKATKPKFQGKSKVSRMQLELWRQLDTKPVFWSLQGWALVLCTVYTSTHPHTLYTHAGATFLFKVRSLPPKEAAMMHDGTGINSALI